MTDTPLDALISKLEAASEGSRELDGAVFHVTYPSVEYSDRLEIWTYKGEHVLLPHYTTSIDAALTLVPDGWTPWDLIARYCTPSEFDAAPALAICIAALRARA